MDMPIALSGSPVFRVSISGMYLFVTNVGARGEAY